MTKVLGAETHLTAQHVEHSEHAGDDERMMFMVDDMAFSFV